MSNLMTLIEKRHSVRSFKNEPVSREQIEHLLESCRLAPSAVNYQPWRFVVVTDPAVREALNAAYPRDWFRDAPVVIVACGDHGASWKRRDGKDHCDIDVAIAGEHLALAAVEAGLGSCWICAFDVAACATALHLPATVEPIALFPIGVPSEDAVPMKVRKELDEIVRWERYE